MNSIRSKIYNWVPIPLRRTLGNSKLLKPFRDIFFRRNGTYIETLTTINKKYLDYSVVFKFYASLQVASKATSKGIENTLLRNSMELVNKFKKKKEGCTIIDVGTNFGYLSLVWAKSLAKHGKVISFEPHPNMFKSFTKSIEANSIEINCIPENMALGNSHELIDINFANTTANVLNVVLLKNPSAKKTEVQMTTLDLYFETNTITDCDLIKIDVDGIELEILRGSKNTIQKYRPIVIVELNLDTKILYYFENIDYTILDMELKPYNKEHPLPGNAFFVPNEIYFNAL